MSDYRERLSGAWTEVKLIDTALAPLRDRRHQVEAAIISSFPTREVKNPNPCRRHDHRECVATFTRDGAERRRELQKLLDAVNKQIRPLTEARREWSREVDHVKHLIEAEQERREAREQREQHELFE